MVARRRPLGPVRAGEASITGWITGDGPHVVMLPSLGRGADDFTDLAGALAAAGFSAVAVDHRGVGSSDGPSDDITLHDYAADAAAVIESLGSGSADVIGHAFGNRVARCLATDRPDLVKRVVLIAAGGRRPIDPDVRTALGRCFDVDLSDDEHMEAVSFAFFAPGNDASVWRDGWWPQASAAQSAAVQRTPIDEWSGAGDDADVLIVQGMHDRVAPPEVGRSLAEDLADRARLIEVEAGHALLPEQPDAIASAVIRFLANDR